MTEETVDCNHQNGHLPGCERGKPEPGLEEETPDAPWDPEWAKYVVSLPQATIFTTPPHIQKVFGGTITVHTTVQFIPDGPEKGSD
jgi:hypothetical protein